MWGIRLVELRESSLMRMKRNDFPSVFGGKLLQGPFFDSQSLNLLQAYPHKILTGRRSKMHTIKKTSGLAGFPKRDESPYDAFGAGHSSTSISAGLGMLSLFVPSFS